MTGPLHESQGESLISQHLKRFSGPLGEMPPLPPPQPTAPPATLTPPPSAPPLMPGWLPWGVAALAMVYALTRSATSTSPPIPEPSSPAPAATALETSSSALLAQLLTSEASHAASASFPPPNPMSAQALDAVMAKFKGMTAGRRDPFLSVMPAPRPPAVPKLPPMLGPAPAPPPPSPPPQVIRVATPAPTLTARLIGVVEGTEPIGLIEVVRNGTPEKRRIRIDEMVTEGFRVAEITPGVVVLHTSMHQVVGMPIGKSISLASTSSPEVPWPGTTASRS